MNTDISDKLNELVSDSIKSNLQSENLPFLDPEDYRKKTGKRFRMSKAQIESGITREQAFREFLETLLTK